MSAVVSLLNGGAVSIFGSILSASFCNALDTRKKRNTFVGCMILILILQGIIYPLWEDPFLQQIYPIFMHLPLLLVLHFLTGKVLWPLISILTAYLCCQLRRWIALLLMLALPDQAAVQDLAEMAITLPLLWFLLYFVAPVLRQLSVYPIKLQYQFGIIPALYYAFDYLTRVYTNLLSSGSPVVVEFMSFVCCAVYLFFLLYHSIAELKNNQFQQLQKSLDLQLVQSVREIHALRESQELARRYRHDLRHHLQYVASCIENEQYKQAQNYISDICREIEAQKIQRYCENEAANLILSSFAGRAHKEGIDLKIHSSLPTLITVSNSDLCVLLSNALENALHACQFLILEGQTCSIDVDLYERNGKIYLQIINPCREKITFKKGLPVSHRPGHGIGIQSICAIVDKYHGIYSFQVKDGQFILRLSL